MPATPDSSRWETLPDGSRRRRRPDAPPAPAVDQGPPDLGLESLGAAHPPVMIEQAEAAATDAAAVLAAEIGIDLSEVAGTGKDGRITKADVEAAAT